MKGNLLNILQMRNAQDRKEQKKEMVHLEWNFIVFLFF